MINWSERRKKNTFSVPFILCERDVFKICVLSQGIVYWDINHSLFYISFPTNYHEVSRELRHENLIFLWVNEYEYDIKNCNLLLSYHSVSLRKQKTKIIAKEKDYLPTNKRF